MSMPTPTSQEASRLIHDRYRLRGEIGRGGMGAVFLAEDDRLPGRLCAIKEVRLSVAIDAEAVASMRAAFLAEATLLARLDHPGLPRVSDHFEEGDSSFLVMDFVPGRDLAAVLDDARSRGRRLDAAQVVGWGERLCEILAYLHRQRPPLVHRDVKPANIKLTPDGQLKLVDFGLAAPGGSEQQAVTVTVQAGGSRPYQPLEQYGGTTETDPRSDLYALGATLYHLMSGHAPPSARERFLDSGILRPLSEARNDLRPATVQAIEVAMSLHPDERPVSAESLRRLLVSAAPTSALVVADGELEPEAGSQGAWMPAVRANAWLLAVVILLLLVGLGLSLRP